MWLDANDFYLHTTVWIQASTISCRKNRPVETEMRSNLWMWSLLFNGTRWDLYRVDCQSEYLNKEENVPLKYWCNSLREYSVPQADEDIWNIYELFLFNFILKPTVSWFICNHYSDTATWKSTHTHAHTHTCFVLFPACFIVAVYSGLVVTHSCLHGLSLCRWCCPFTVLGIRHLKPVMSVLLPWVHLPFLAVAHCFLEVILWIYVWLLGLCEFKMILQSALSLLISLRTYTRAEYQKQSETHAAVQVTMNKLLPVNPISEPSE